MDRSLIPGLALVLASLGMLAWSLFLRRRHRLVHDLPTSKAQGVFIGLVELKGTAEAEAPLRSYLAEARCVHYGWTVEERWSRTVTETYTDSDGKTKTRTRHESGWKTVASGGETIAFYVQDDTGAVLVRPSGAKIETCGLFSETVSRGDALYYQKGPPDAVSHSDHVRRFNEAGIPLHAELFIVGRARERADVVAPEIAEDREAPLFLISCRSEERVLSGYGLGSWITWLLGLAAAVGAGAVLGEQSVRFAPRDDYRPLFVGGGAFLLLWSAAWVSMVYNSLVGLRERVRQSWSLIDVELKRRHDLIPALVAALDGLRAHEQTVQTALARFRAQSVATPPGVAGPDFQGLAASLRVVAENYPELKTQPNFARLHAELVTTEQRVALARTYYNDTATHFATRLERVPDRWVARLGRMQPAPLLAASDFERAEVRVRFADGD
ncbi:MAG: LemA family protein [Opitutae bacterium]|nr:LemA family protein [Opitutae bacterium]